MSRAATIAVDPTRSVVPAPGLAFHEPASVPAVTQQDPILRMMDKALEMGQEGVAALTGLIDLHERAAAKIARNAFFRDFASFQEKCGAVPKNRTSDDGGANRPGKKFAFGWTDLEGIAGHVNPILFPLGFSYSWNTEQDEKGATAIFVLRHRDGHSEELSRAKCGYDSSLPIAPQQKTGVSLSYAKRYSMMQALGIVTADPDEGQRVDPTPITEDQAASLEALRQEVKGNGQKFLSHFGISALSEMKASQYAEAVRMLESLRRKA